MQSKRPTGLELALLVVIVLVIAGAALIGDGGQSDEEGSAGTARPSGPQRVDVAAIKRRVERLRDLRFRHPLNVTFASRQQAQNLISKANESEYSRRELLIDEEELKLFGLLRPSSSLGRYLRAIDEEQVLGFYDDRSKRLVVVRGEGDSRGLQEIVLAHELVHALEDQHFGIEGSEGFSDDRGFAESALFEGTATALMIDYAARYLTLSDAFDALEDVGGAETKLPGFVEDLLLFPYEQGQRFVATLRAGGSWRAVDNVIRFRRPRTTEQVIHLASYADGERAVGLRALDARRVLGEGWRRLDATALGELDLRLLFEHAGGVDDPTAAAGWGGGRLELWRRRTDGSACPAPCVRRDAAVMVLAWDSRRDRVQAEDAFRRVFERGLAGKRLAARRGIGLWSSRGGAIGMRARGRAMTVALAPSAQRAKLLLE